MRRAKTLLVSVLFAASALGVSAQGTLAFKGEVWSNSDAFTSRCLGFTDTYPQQMYSLNTAQMTALGYKPVGGALGSLFTKTNFLGNVFYDYAVYAHTHASIHSYAPAFSTSQRAVVQSLYTNIESVVRSP